MMRRCMMMSSMREADGVGRVFAVRARAKGREERRESYPVTCSKRVDLTFGRDTENEDILTYFKFTKLCFVAC